MTFEHCEEKSPLSSYGIDQHHLLYFLCSFAIRGHVETVTADKEYWANICSFPHLSHFRKSWMVGCRSKVVINRRG